MLSHGRQDLYVLCIQEGDDAMDSFEVLIRCAVAQGILKKDGR